MCPFNYSLQYNCFTAMRQKKKKLSAHEIASLRLLHYRND